MKKRLMLLVLAAILLGGCNGMANGPGRPGGRSAVINRAATCAVCGASVPGSYFVDSVDRALGPGQGW